MYFTIICYVLLLHLPITVNLDKLNMGAYIEIPEHSDIKGNIGNWNGTNSFQKLFIPPYNSTHYELIDSYKNGMELNFFYIFTFPNCRFLF